MNIYFDNAATTKVHPRVIQKMIPYLNDTFGNPSAVHSYGRKARVAIEEARERIAEFINADPSEIYFTSCATESNNFIISGIAKTDFNETKRKTIITTNGEHKSVLNTIKNLTSEGFDSYILPIDKNFIVNSNDVIGIERTKVSTISVIHTNNETGAINNIRELANNFRSSHIHTDAVQSFGKFKIDVNKLGIHGLSASAHKFYGPKGIGLAYVRSGTPMSSLIFGGGQERNRRAGTENVASIVGFAEAVSLANEFMHENYKYVSKLKQYFIDVLKNSEIKNIHLNSSESDSPYILSFTFDPEYYNNDSEAILMFLDINGIAASAGSACTSGTLKPSHVILEAGYSEEYAKGTLRFSFSPENTIKEIDYALRVLVQLAEKIKK